MSEPLTPQRGRRLGGMAGECLGPHSAVAMAIVSSMSVADSGAVWCACVSQVVSARATLIDVTFRTFMSRDCESVASVGD